MGAPRHIVHLTPNLDFGGLQEVVKNLALGQLALGHRVTILCWEYPGAHVELEQLLVDAGATVEPARAKGDGRLASFRSLRARLARDHVDVLHTHNPFENCLHGALAGRSLRGTKVVNTLHASFMFTRFGWPAKTGYQAAILLLDRVVVVCDEMVGDVRGRFRVPKGRVAIVENGIDTSRFLSLDRHEPRKEIVFGLMGRMAGVKNHDLLIEAFTLASAEDSRLRLRLLGSGPLEEQLKALVAERGLGGVVEFRGFSHDVAGFLQDIDVFVLPSKSEGLPLSLLEAIAAGLPVVASDVGGVPRVVEKTGAGWVCPPNDRVALKDALLAAAASSYSPARSDHARAVVADYYGAVRMTADYEAVYAGVLA